MTNICPLYEGYELPTDVNQRMNKALLFDKLCNVWEGPPKWTLGQAKGKWLNQFAGKVGDKVLIDNYVARTQALVEEQGGKLLFFCTASRFVTGIGNVNPVENGFAWHPTLGTPYIPGSTIKGMVRSWLNSSGLDDKVADIFGSAGVKDSGKSGSIIFFDALPIRRVSLVVDVMTPHYSDYYKGDKQQPPGDWQSPVPIPFLTVDSNQKFMFAIAPMDKEAEKLMDSVEGYLLDVLDKFGAGAKTAVGYGRFVIDTPEMEGYQKERAALQAERQKQRELAAMSPVRRQMNQDGYNQENFISRIDFWLGRAEKASGEERREIAEALRTWYQQHRPGFFENPNKKNKDRISILRSMLD